MQYPPSSSDSSQGVTITDIKIPFGRLVVIILKTMLASLPAVLLMYAMMFAVMLVFLALIGGVGALTGAAQKKIDFLPAPTEQR